MLLGAGYHNQLPGVCNVVFVCTWCPKSQSQIPCTCSVISHLLIISMLKGTIFEYWIFGNLHFCHSNDYWSFRCGVVVGVVVVVVVAEVSHGTEGHTSALIPRPIKYIVTVHTYITPANNTKEGNANDCMKG